MDREITHKRSRDCILCNSKGHGKNECPCLLKYGKPLPQKDPNSRQQLMIQLMDPNSFQNIYRDKTDERIVRENMRQVIPALIIHRRMIIDTNIVNHVNTYNLCCECTLLKEGGEINELEAKVLYHVKDICCYVTKNKDNLFVCMCNSA